MTARYGEGIGFEVGAAGVLYGDSGIVVTGGVAAGFGVGLGVGLFEIGLKDGKNDGKTEGLLGADDSVGSELVLETPMMQEICLAH